VSDKKHYYVYEHWRPDTGECFYVGKGQGDRAYFMKRRSKHHKNIVSKLETMGMCVEVRLYASGLIEKEAFELEKVRIAHYKNLGFRLANKTEGGDGISGYRHTEEAKIHFSKIFKGRPKNKGTTGLKLSEETRKKMSEIKKGKKPNNFGKSYKKKPLTEEARKNMSLAGKKRAQTEEFKILAREAGKKGAAARWGKEP